MLVRMTLRGTAPGQVSGARTAYLDALRIVAVCGVVAIHAFASLVVDEEAHGTRGWWAAVFADLGNVWVVPVFVMVSGALLLTQRAQAGGPANFYRRRLLRLGPAFVFWQLFYLLVVRVWISGEELSLGQVFVMLADGRPYTHLYFLWLIVGLYAVAPLMYPFLAQGSRRRAVLTAGVILAATALAYTAASLETWGGAPRSIVLSAFTQWIPYVGFFVAGAALSGLRIRRRWGALAAVAAVIVLGVIVLEYALVSRTSLIWAVLPVGYSTILTVLASLAVFVAAQGLLGEWRPAGPIARALKTLSDASFGVFLVHFVLMILIRELFPWTVEPQRTSFWAASVIWAALVVSSFAIAVVARRIPIVRRVF